jgi:tetratricopeptide (TPR) repeat protein
MNQAGDLTEHAVRLDADGFTAAARASYLAALAAAADYAPALHGLGALLSRTVYRQLVACHPHDAGAHVGLGQALLLAGEQDPARRHFECALSAQPGFAEAHQGLGNICAARGDPDGAAHHWRLGYGGQVFNAWAYRGLTAPIRVLLLISVKGGNMRARSLLDDTVFAVVSAAMEFVTASHELPAHDLVVNAVSDADLCGAALDTACALVARTDAPVINHPAAVAQTGRAANAARLGMIEHVMSPATKMLRREALLAGQGAALLRRAGFRFPLLLRAPGFHTGQHFIRVLAPEALPAAAAGLPGDEVLVIAYLEPAGVDGFARKGRVMIVDGRLYPLHWAISATWKVHYFTACMAGSAAHRAEESHFLNDMAGFLGGAAMRALEAIAARLGLDYAGIDFAVSAAGKIMLFEANAAMVILAPAQGEIWDYRREAAAIALGAARGMMQRRANVERGRPAHRGCDAAVAADA